MTDLSSAYTVATAVYSVPIVHSATHTPAHTRSGPMAAKKKTFSTQDDELLVEQVKKYPNLYNSSLPEYRDHGRNEQSWLAIRALLIP